MSDERKFRRKRKGAVSAHLKSTSEATAAPVADHLPDDKPLSEPDAAPTIPERAMPIAVRAEPASHDELSSDPPETAPVAPEAPVASSDPLELTPDLQFEEPDDGPTISPPAPVLTPSPPAQSAPTSPKPVTDELPQDRTFTEEDRKRQRQAKLKALRDALPEEREAPLTLSDPIEAQPSLAEPKAQPAWADLREIALSAPHLSQHHVVTAERSDPAHSAFDVLRTRLLQALSDNGWSRVAITSPTKDCGKTFTAANLAISLARQENCRTLLMDLDMRRPSLHKVMGVENPGSIGDMLRGVQPADQHLHRLGDNDFHAGHNIAFGFNEVIEPFAAELLQDPRAEQIMTDIQQTYQPDVVLYDLPPALYYDDVIAFRPQFDGVLLVLGGGLSTEKEVREVERRLGDSTPLLGMVLNKAENTDIQRYRY